MTRLAAFGAAGGALACLVFIASLGLSGETAAIWQVSQPGNWLLTVAPIGIVLGAALGIIFRR